MAQLKMLSLMDFRSIAYIESVTREISEILKLSNLLKNREKVCHFLSPIEMRERFGYFDVKLCRRRRFWPNCGLMAAQLKKICSTSTPAAAVEPKQR